MKAIGYCRVSTEDQAREGISLDNQEAKIRAYAKLNDLDLQEVIRDEGVSGTKMDRSGLIRLLRMMKATFKPHAKREPQPGLTKILDIVEATTERDLPTGLAFSEWSDSIEVTEASEIDAIIVYKLDRLSRRVKDTLDLIELFENKGIAFHSISERLDTKSAGGRFFLTITAALAQMERDLVAERTRDALHHKKTKGEWVGRIPHGFRLKGKHLEADPEQLRTIQKAKRLRRNGKTFRDIAEALQVPKSAVHRLVNTNLKTLKANYINGLAA